MLYLLCLGLFMPLVGFLALFFSARYIGRLPAVCVGCGTIFISLVCFISLLIAYISTGAVPQTYVLFDWIHFNNIHANFALHLDPLALLMTLIITGVGFLIHVYSVGYMDHEEDFARFFACMNFFIFAMLLLVLAAELLLLFVGWEGVGLASYLLIGFWYQKPEAAEAATKAFIVNRIGDLALLLGLILTFYLFHTSDIATVSSLVNNGFAVGAPIITLLTLLYFIGATGKSAQIPLQTWLPDAMAGPTPVSALIHAATMVTAGVYLVVRMHVVFTMAPMTLQIIGITGGVTSLYASLSALGQTDLKRVLAYSTVSQLGLMFLACGAGAFYAAMFHLTTHAFIKAVLFLSAGNVVHMMSGTTEMSKMGGLSKIFTKTHWLFLIAALSLSGIPPLAAFFSKDLILENEYLVGYEALYYVALTASILTGIYLTRAYCLTFSGPQHLNAIQQKDVKEAPSIMIAPVLILTFFSIFGGFLGFSFNSIPWLEDFIEDVDVTHLERELTTSFNWSYEGILAIAGAISGVLASAFVYTNFQNRLGKPIQFLKQSFYFDKIYHWILVVPLKAIANGMNRYVEPKIFDGSVNALAYGTQGIARAFQLVQSGQIRAYVAWMALGAMLLIVYLVF
ncbi:MAG: NADH-quinone oxidoreductase subunit L [Parachlamydiaceae bacterium]|nr:NADH-quinone oxidoreductase subunit L [Parachlamydiaceae bacterium]